MAETNGLLNRRTGKSGTEGSNPSVSANPFLALLIPPCTSSGASGSIETWKIIQASLDDAGFLTARKC